MSGLKSIVLIGPMGAGKTTVGRELSKSLQLDFIDTDVELEQQFGSSINAIFQEHGEAFFRVLESSVIAKIKISPIKVIASGGGSILDPTNRQLLRSLGTVCYLRVSIETQIQRLAHDTTRPLYLLPSMAQRIPLYESIADFNVNTDNQSIDALVAQLKSLMHEQICHNCI